MNEKVIGLLRNVRTGLQVAVEPIDWASRMLNNKQGYPPLWIRQKVGGLNDFEGSGAEYIAYLKLLCNLKPGDNVLDLGCGCGLTCLPVNENGIIPEYLGSSGRYVGLDTDYNLIQWCKKNIRYPICQFITTQEELREYRFDVVLCKSLFTHLFQHEVIEYLSLIKERLVPNGYCLSTWFLLKDIKPKGRYTFEHDEGNFSLQRYSKPRLAIAYDEKWLLDYLKKLEFSVIQVYYGNWRGNNKGLSFQDIVVVRK